MKRNKTQTEKTSESCRCVLCIAVIAVLAMFASCQRPDPEPEPPTPPVVDTDTLPANKFVGTWVLCSMNSVDDEPPATCDLANGTIDTLVFTNDKRFTRYHGEKIFEYWYEFTEHYLITYRYTDTTYSSAKSIQYNFRENDEELVLSGIFYISHRKNYCFRRITND
jgi:hypothetical protein